VLDIGGIDTAAVGQYPALLFGIKGDLVAVKYRLKGFGLAIGQAIDELVAFQSQSDDLSCIVRFHFLVLNPHGLNGNHRCLGTKTVAAGGTDFHLARELLALDL
jgi:hypothetical protein